MTEGLDPGLPVAPRAGDDRGEGRIDGHGHAEGADTQVIRALESPTGPPFLTGEDRDLPGRIPEPEDLPAEVIFVAQQLVQAQDGSLGRPVWEARVGLLDLRPEVRQVGVDRRAGVG